jgi:hypothetical protein
MSNELAVSMAELQLESAELLPSRETLNVCCHRGQGNGIFDSFNSFDFTDITQNGNQTGLLNVGILNFNGDGLF